MKRVLGLGVAGLVAVSIIAAWFFIATGRGTRTEGADHSTTTREQPVSSQATSPGVTLTASRQRLTDIHTRKLAARQHQQELTAYGRVLAPRPLLSLVKNHTDTQAQVSKARARLAVSRAEYQRLKGLYEHNRNVSINVYQHARARWLVDRADLRSARASFQSALDRLEQAWGTQIAQWARDDSAELKDLLNQDSRLIQLTLPAGASLPSPPQTAVVTTITGSRLSVQLVSPSPRTDPMLQGRSFLYIVKPPVTGLPYGSSVVGHLPYGPRRGGIVVPGLAVVWWQGRAWVYVQTDADRFVRHSISTGIPVARNFFVRRGVTPGDSVVVRGAQILFSEESLGPAPEGRVQAEDEGD